MLRPAREPLYFGWAWPLIRAIVRRALPFVLGLVWVFWGIIMLPDSIARVAYARGEPATAKVDECRWLSSRVPYLECRGTWVYDDGRAGNGEVSGVAEADVGTLVRVRARATSARAAPASPATLLIVTAVPAAGTIAYWHWRRRRAAERRRASPPPPPPPFRGRTIEGEWH
ncbi:MAG TPA: hypothetical protein VFT95_20380 [Micromonosporaceae bacterium]|nr:hypothetical protein [Micromonosporaceae bacterium]